MNLYRQFAFPLLRRMDAEHAHDLMISGLGRGPAAALCRVLAGRLPQMPVDFCGLRFPNPLGIAAGLDKDVRIAAALGALGFGHVEVGTLTPRPQPGNPKPRVFRLPQDQAIINRMGFPNGGVEEALPRLRRLAQRGAAERGFVLGVSLGKQKETALEAAAEDYIAVLRATYPFCDYFAVNISSPNTAGLRALQGRELLDGLLGPLMQARAALAEGEGRRGKPLLLKIAPDLESDELDAVLGAIDAHDVDGIIATNTTLSREGLTGEARHETGGMSGRPLAARATAMIRAIRERTEGALPIIGVGGIFDARDVREKLDAGASLVQVYSGMVYEGPGMAGRILRELTRQ